LSILSFVLCLATVGWWYRTSRKVDQLTYQRPAVESLSVSGYSGKVVVTHALQDSSQSRLGPAQLAWNSTSPGKSMPEVSKSFSYTNQTASTGGGRESMLILPLWLITAAFAVMPLCWVGSRVRRKRKAHKAQEKAKE
jgi:hypothetical protein